MSTEPVSVAAPQRTRHARIRQAARARKTVSLPGQQDNDLPLGAYTRLTVDRDGNKLGYEVQSKVIKKWATDAERELIWYQDKDLTAADFSVERPGYEQMLTDLKDGKIGGIVVWRLDRLVRLAREFERCNAAVQDANGFIVVTSGDNAMDTRTGGGLLIMRIMVNLAEAEITAMKARQVGHQRLRAEKGLVSGGGIRPFGFKGSIKDNEGKVLNRGHIFKEHEPVEVALLRDAAQRIAFENVTYPEILREWSVKGVRGTKGKFFSASGLQDILTSPRTAGKRDLDIADEETGEVKTLYFKAEWDPILDEKTWLKLCGMRNFRERETGRPVDYLLGGGLVTCSQCDHKLTGSSRKKYRNYKMVADSMVRAYRCPSTPEPQALGGTCGKINILADPVEALAVAFVLTRLSRTTNWLPPEDSSAVDKEIGLLLRTIEECETELLSLANLRSLPSGHPDKLNAEEWLILRRETNKRREIAEKRVQTLSRAASIPTPSAADRDNLDAWYNSLSFQQQRALLRHHIASIGILPARRGNRFFDPARVQITPADQKQTA